MLICADTVLVTVPDLWSMYSLSNKLYEVVTGPSLSEWLLVDVVPDTFTVPSSDVCPAMKNKLIPFSVIKSWSCT